MMIWISINCSNNTNKITNKYSINLITYLKITYILCFPSKAGINIDFKTLGSQMIINF